MKPNKKKVARFHKKKGKLLGVKNNKLRIALGK